MPILEVEIVLPPGEGPADGLARTLADRAGEIFGSAPGGTWVRVRGIPREHYAENGSGPEDGIHPVFVTVLKSSLPPAEALAVEIIRLTHAVAEACDRPAENVHIVYLPPAAGRVAFGGKLVPPSG